MADVTKGQSFGPFDEDGITALLGTEDWICAYRFGV